MAVPKFKEYFASVDMLDEAQAQFYKELVHHLNNRSYLDVEGNISYLFIYVYDWIRHPDNFEPVDGAVSGSVATFLVETGIERISLNNSIGYYEQPIYSVYTLNKDKLQQLQKNLTWIAELYKHEAKFSGYCLHWAHECLLAKGDYQGFLDITEPSLANKLGNLAMYRLSIQKFLNLPANPLDVAGLVDFTRSPFVKQHLGVFTDKVKEEMERHITAEYGTDDWFHVIDKCGTAWQDRLDIFSGVSFQDLGWKKPSVPIPSWFFPTRRTANDPIEEEILSVVRKAENSARRALDVPEIGQGWISETLLFKHLATVFPKTRIIQHGRPAFLGRQHYDIWFLDWRIAVEYHGQQHFAPVDFFGGEEAFKNNVERDQRKARLSQENGVKLFVVTKDDAYENIVQMVREHAVSMGWRA